MTRPAVTTLDLIQQYSNERQGLWRLASRCGLSSDQRGRLKDLDKVIIPRLWHTRRTEIAYENRGRKFEHDRVHGDLFCDYIERLSGDRFMGADDWEEVSSIEYVKPIKQERAGRPSKALNRLQELMPLLTDSNHPLDKFGATALLEVLTEMKMEDAMKHALDQKPALVEFFVQEIT